MKDLRKVVQSTKKEKYIIFETEEQNVFVNTINDMIDEEKFLSDRHGYNVSSIYDKLKGINTQESEDVEIDEESDDSDYNPMWDYMLLIICAFILYFTLKKTNK